MKVCGHPHLYDLILTFILALGALLSNLQTDSVANTTASKGQVQSLSKEALERLAAKINELVGEEFTLPQDQVGEQNFNLILLILNSQPTNEEGLPIIELNEPVSNVSQASEFIYEPKPLREPPQSDAERVARRRERDALLDALEAEERLKRGSEEREFLKIVRETKEKFQEEQTDENTKQNTRIHEISSAEDNGSREPSKDLKRENNKAGKSVSFADVPDGDKEEVTPQRNLAWGSVQQARLKASIGPKTGEGIMKLNIIERFPSTSKSLHDDASADSDDQDDVEEDEEVLSADDENLDEEDEMQRKMEDEMQHREIALRYHQQRQTLGSGPSGGALGGEADIRQDEVWDREVRVMVL